MTQTGFVAAAAAAAAAFRTAADPVRAPRLLPRGRSPNVRSGRRGDGGLWAARRQAVHCSLPLWWRHSEGPPCCLPQFSGPPCCLPQFSGTFGHRGQLPSASGSGAGAPTVRASVPRGRPTTEEQSLGNGITRRISFGEALAMAATEPGQDIRRSATASARARGVPRAPVATTVETRHSVLSGRSSAAVDARTADVDLPHVTRGRGEYGTRVAAPAAKSTGSGPTRRAVHVAGHHGNACRNRPVERRRRSKADTAEQGPDALCRWDRQQNPSRTLIDSRCSPYSGRHRVRESRSAPS